MTEETIDSFLDKYTSLSQKETNACFNSFSIKERKMILFRMDEDEERKFISDIRTQAVRDFWTHEQSLIKEGKCTRDWTPDQIESILNISDKTGIMSINGDKAVDINGKAYFGHHMLSVAKHPELAGDWRNVQALDYDEHFKGAHAGNTKNLTEAYYDPETKLNFKIDESKLEKGADVKSGESIIPTRICIFESDKRINEKYANVGQLKDGERLALKNVELSKTPKGTLKDYDRAFVVADKYKCADFAEKFKLSQSPLAFVRKSIEYGNVTYNDSKNNRAKVPINKTEHAQKVVLKRGRCL